MGDAGEYEEDAQRIDREYIPDDAVTQQEISQALDDAGFPQASQTHIEGWMTTEEDAWDAVGPRVQDADSVRRAVDRDDGVADAGRAQSIADSVAGEINAARAQAAQRVTDDGQVRTEDGRFIGKLQNVSEQVRSDGIYYVNENTGTEGRAARFDR